jgi:ribose 1,5-bisphosphokinase PhnN
MMPQKVRQFQPLWVVAVIKISTIFSFARRLQKLRRSEDASTRERLTRTEAANSMVQLVLFVSEDATTTDGADVLVF